MLRTVGVGAFGVSGCLGGGGEVVLSVTESVTVEPGSGWTKEIPDVSDPGGAVTYVVRSDDAPFDVYLFADRSEYEYYDAYVTDEEPSETPPGLEAFNKAAVPTSESANTYQAATEDGGARESLDAEGPYYFVVDHSNYRMENRVGEDADSLSAFVDLEVVRKHVGI